MTVKDGKLLLKIPRKLKWHKKFEAVLLEKWKHLIERKRTEWKRREGDTAWIFGEQVSLVDLGLKTDSSDQEFQTILKGILSDYCTPIIDYYANLLWYSWSALSMRRLRSKWWSCSSNQNISLNLDLVHLPTRLVRYVVIHEVCHLKHKHHQQSFWAEVEWFFPDYKQVRKELKAIRFSY